MKKLPFLFVLAFFMGSAAQASDISGVYDGKNVTVTIEKDGPAWRLECDDQSAGHTYLSKEKKTITDPFEPSDKCRPKKQLTDNVYRVTVTPKIKIECRIIPKPGTLAEYYPVNPELDDLIIHPYMYIQLASKEPPVLLLYKAGYFDDDCRKLEGDLKKIK